MYPGMLQLGLLFSCLAHSGKNQLLDEHMQHDLGTTFSGLLAASNIIYNQENDPSKKQLQGLVIQSASCLLQLLDQILEVSDLGDHPIVYDQFDLQEAVNEITELLNAEIQAKGLNSSVQCDKINICTNRMRFNRILINLLGNAVKFTSQGKVALKIEVKPGCLGYRYWHA
jgi:signal transduction histidine kinase